MYYLNAIGLGRGGGVIRSSSDPGSAQGYIFYQLQLAAGPQNVKHIPIYQGSTFETRWQMFGEMIEIPTWSPIVADAIAQDLQDSPLLPGQDIVLVGESGGGTVAIEALDLLEVIGIEVDQVILRGSPVHELFLSNVNRVDYITSKLDYYYSFDVNPVDGVQVNEYRIDFWGHVPPDNRAWMEIGLLIHNLILEGR